MACSTARARLLEYVDGALAPSQRPDLEAHLAACPDCARLCDLERTFHQRFVAPLRPDPVPERVREQVGRLLAALPEPKPSGRWRPRRPRLALAAAASVLVLVGGALGVAVSPYLSRVLLDRGGVTAQLADLAEASIDQHRKLARGLLPHDITPANPKTAEQWFRQRLDFNINLPELSSQGLTFVGGRVSHLRDIEVAMLHYRVEGTDVSLFLIPPDRYRRLALGETPKFKMVTHQGYDVIVWTSHGAAYALVSEIGGRSCLVCHSPEEDLGPVGRSHL